MRDPPFEPEDGTERHQRQRLESRLLLGEGLIDDPPCGRVDPRVGDRVEPVAQLGVEVVEVLERAGEEEVLADVAVRPLDLALIRHDEGGAQMSCWPAWVGGMVRPSGTGAPGARKCGQADP
jgi:hypothetical protein